MACVFQDDVLILFDHAGRKPWRNVDNPTLVFDDKVETARAETRWLGQALLRFYALNG